MSSEKVAIKIKDNTATLAPDNNIRYHGCITLQDSSLGHFCMHDTNLEHDINPTGSGTSGTASDFTRKCAVKHA
jgi:hypothetical protein